MAAVPRAGRRRRRRRRAGLLRRRAQVHAHATSSPTRTSTTARATCCPKYGVTGFPETYFVDRRGRLVGERDRRARSARQKLTAGIRRALAVVRDARWSCVLALGARCAGARERAPPDARRARGRGDVPDVQDDARPVDRADRRPDPAVHLGADRRRRHEERDQARSSSPSSGRRSSPSRRSTGSTCSRGCCRSSGSGSARVALGVARLALDRARASRSAAARAAARPGARPPGGRRACSLRRREPQLPVAFAVGFISIVTPCVLPLVPGYLSAVSAVEARRLGEPGTWGGGSCSRACPFVARVHGRLRPARRRRGGDRERLSKRDADTSSPASS